MYFIKHLGHRFLGNYGEESPIYFYSEADALQYLEDCGELDNLGKDWAVCLAL